MNKHDTHRSDRYHQPAIFLHIYILLLIFSVSSQTHASEVSQQSCTATISNIQVAKAIPHDLEQKPAAGWHPVQKLPEYWNTRWPNYHATAWYKINFNYLCPQSTKTPISLVIKSMNMAGQIYINDAFIWQDQSLIEPVSRSWLKPRYWVIPAEILHPGENTLWIRITGIATQKSGLSNVNLGPHQAMMKLYQHYELELRTLSLLNMMINIVVGLLCFAVWFFTPKEVAFKWFGIVSLLWISYVFLVQSTETVFNISNTLQDQISILVFCCYTVAGSIAAWRFARQKYPKIELLLLIYIVSAFIFILLIPNVFLPKTLNLFFLIGVIIFLLKCISFPYIAYKSKNKEAYILAIQYLIFIPIAINDAHYMITLEGTILSPYTSPTSSILIGAILALRLANNSKKIALFHKTLTDEVTKAKVELSISLNAQHQLALENVKLQERINLSHDLHDGLGGSIVRSMILLDHAEKVEKHQVLSMFKLLRNDLRQVIDSGSSLDIKTPESPIMWIAPLRHRFVQLFEDMEIESTWIFAKSWGRTPHPLHCLTLSRVAEEALTNIVKHSHASDVEVSLIENEQQLILEIKDNGQGFEPQRVQDGLHVGLQSMKIRIERIGGSFHISSEYGLTVIRAIIPHKIIG